eukprot:TRINITY_DN34135_c0_g1_i1.p1 TRINITY_DN34135_c0_g1~~TRINITY_DN34135_c0_g1_i1.p1  ORF type:complete len:236 (+),score=33.56 TRINITY_DN34135_c0_g1_i1:65-709(+)
MEMQKSGDWVVIDVRPKELYEKASAEGALSVPLFQSMDFSNASPRSFLRAAAYALNGVKAVEFNPNFSEEMKERAGGKNVVLMCEAGGTMKPSSNFLNGKTSRSLKAAYITLTEGLAPKVAHLDGGVYGWYLSKSPMRGEYDISNVGRTPNAAAEAEYPEATKKEEVSSKQIGSTWDRMRFCLWFELLMGGKLSMPKRASALWLCMQIGLLFVA